MIQCLKYHPLLSMLEGRWIKCKSGKEPIKFNAQWFFDFFEYSGISFQGTFNLWTRQVSSEWRFGCSLLIINQQIKYFSFILPQNLLQTLLSFKQVDKLSSSWFFLYIIIMYKKNHDELNYLCDAVCWSTPTLSEVVHVLKAVTIMTSERLNFILTFFVVSHFLIDKVSHN